jgi:hypothetical protein
MKNYFFLQPRQSGKTLLAIYECLKDIEHSVLVVNNKKSLKEASKLNNQIKVIKASSTEDYLMSNSTIDKVVFDKKDKENIYRIVKNSSIKNIYIFSTPNKVYSRYVFDLVKAYKNNIFDDSTLDQIQKLTSIEKEEFTELCLNLITEPNMVLIKHKLTNFNDSFNYIEMEKNIGKEKFKTEYLNQYLK